MNQIGYVTFSTCNTIHKMQTIGSMDVFIFFSFILHMLGRQLVFTTHVATSFSIIENFCNNLICIHRLKMIHQCLPVSDVQTRFFQIPVFYCLRQGFFNIFPFFSVSVRLQPFTCSIHSTCTPVLTIPAVQHPGFTTTLRCWQCSKYFYFGNYEFLVTMLLIRFISFIAC